MGKVSIATKRSRDLIRQMNKAEKNGEVIDWDSVFDQVKELEAKGRSEEIKAIMNKKG